MKLKDEQKIVFLIAGLNLLVLAVYQLILSSSHGMQLMSAICIVLHLLFLLTTSAALSNLGKNSYALGFGISALLVLTAGYGTCALF